MKGTVGVGVVGLGFMGRTHFGAYHAVEGAEVRAVLDPSEPKGAAGNLVSAGEGGDEAAARLAETPRASDLDDLLSREDISLVSICTPTDTHAALLRKVIAAGRHAIVEKPVSLDADEIEALDREARAAGVLVMPAHCMRFWPAWRWMRDAVAERRFGAPLRASFRRIGARPAWSQSFYLDVARSGGAVVDLHIHDTDFVRHCFGEPASVEARGDRFHVDTRFRYEDGLVVEAEGAWMEDPDHPFMMVASIECERGVIDFRLGRDPELLVLADGTPAPVVAGRDYPEGAGYEHEVRAMVEAVSAGATEAPITLADAAATQRLLDREIAMLD